jgi:D-psicose/D-tagatose/L-ribulose 3-epimerase
LIYPNKPNNNKREFEYEDDPYGGIGYMYKYSATQWIFGNESIEKSLLRLKKYGYDGVELAGEPYSINVEEVNRLLRQYEMSCTSICGIYTKERDLSSSNETIRRNTVQYVKDCVDMAASVRASHVIVVPSSVGKNRPDTNRTEEWENAVANLKETGEYASSKNIKLAIEALNRFETYLVNNMETALSLVKQINIKSVNIMADLFHMNIEERSHTEALKKIALYLIHVHIADNTREAAGLGQTDFEIVMKTLKEINYQGPITMEFLPPVSNPYLAAKSTGSDDLFDRYTEKSITEIKRIVKKLSGQ